MSPPLHVARGTESGPVAREPRLRTAMPALRIAVEPEPAFTAEEEAFFAAGDALSASAG